MVLKMSKPASGELPGGPTPPSHTYNAIGILVDRLIKWTPVNITTSGLENIPEDRNFILGFAHHNSHDAPALAYPIWKKVGRAVFFLTKQELLEDSLLSVISGPVFRSAHAQGVSRENTTREQWRAAEDVVRRGDVLGSAIEGRRVNGHKIADDLKDGAARISAKTGVPILGAAVAGHNWRLRGKSLSFVPRSMHVHYSELLVPATNGSAKQKKDALMEQMPAYLQNTLNMAYDGYLYNYGALAASHLDRSPVE